MAWDAALSGDEAGANTAPARAKADRRRGEDGAPFPPPSRLLPARADVFFFTRLKSPPIRNEIEW